MKWKNWCKVVAPEGSKGELNKAKVKTENAKTEYLKLKKNYGSLAGIVKGHSVKIQ
jgi:hypothetical protein